MQSRERRLLGRLAMLGPIAFTAAWLIAGVAEDEYSVRREDISALAAIDAQYPWIMITGFLLLALGCVALAVGLASAIAGWSARIGSLLLLIAGLGLAVAGLARNDCSSELEACAARVEAGLVSRHHVLHDDVSLLIFLSLAAAPFVPCAGVPSNKRMARSAGVLHRYWSPHRCPAGSVRDRIRRI